MPPLVKTSSPEPRVSRIVSPGSRPSEAPLPKWRLAAGVLCCAVGFIAIFVGGSEGRALIALWAGFGLVLFSMWCFGALKIGRRGTAKECDPRKLYGTPKA